MENDAKEIPRVAFIGLCLSLAAILFGFGMGGVFGGMESSIKSTLNESGTAVLDSAYGGDVAAKDAVVAKSWDYLKRAHLHGGAIGTAGVAVILALISLSRLDTVARWSALALGLGAILYSLFWLFAGLKAPGLGGTGAAKEAFGFLGIPGSALSILGLSGAMFALIRDRLSKSRTS